MTCSEITNNGEGQKQFLAPYMTDRFTPGAAVSEGDEKQIARAACTIVSSNYMHYARVLAESFHRFHPECPFYVLLVDRLPEGIDLSSASFQLILVEQLGIPDFGSVAFRFDILELNTNVKSTFLTYLLDQGIDQVIYFDPDIFLYSTADPVFDLLDDFSILVTPHCLSPNADSPYAEILLLVNGVFNLGFIAVSNTAETRRFLAWWEHRCLNLGYEERWTGLFVDQKWINLVPCYFDSVYVLKNLGCNMAYWNLHERILTNEQNRWIVNHETTLIFFHFSGISLDDGNQISRHTEQFDLSSRPDLVEIFTSYRKSIMQAKSPYPQHHRYAFGFFTDGKPVNKLQRAAFAANLDRFKGTDPFDSGGAFYRWSKEKHLGSKQDSVASLGRKAYNPRDIRIRAVNGALRALLRLVGADRYTVLMKYLEFASILRNQKDIWT
jgi:hypothetical protein